MHYVSKREVEIVFVKVPVFLDFFTKKIEFLNIFEGIERSKIIIELKRHDNLFG